MERLEDFRSMTEKAEITLNTIRCMGVNAGEGWKRSKVEKTIVIENLQIV